MKTPRIALIFAAGLVVFAFGTAVRNAVFDNYLVDTFQFTAEQRGALEVPRELPGLLVTLTIGACCFLPEVRLLGLSCLVAAAGMFGLGSLSPNTWSMVWWVFAWSMGAHVQMVLIERVALDVGLARGAGEKLGRMNGLRSLGMIAGALFVVLFSGSRPNYRALFTASALAMTLGGALYLTMRAPDKQKRTQRAPFVLKKRYTRYYVLAVLFGMRKQIFITFAPWFLVRILDFRPQHIARILLVSAAFGIFLKPLLGRLIDRWGERRVLVLDGLISVCFCMGYVVLPRYFDGLTLALLVSACYMLDDLMFTLRTARTTWLVKIAEKPEDVTATMSVSVSLDHALSMTISWFAGLAWIYLGYQSVFLLCAAIAVSMAVVSAGIKLPPGSSAASSELPAAPEAPSCRR